jgi:hypothetical protein
MMGRFYDAFHGLGDTFIKVKATLKDCPHIPKEKVDDIINTYGEDHPFTQSAVFGNFMAQPDNDPYVFNSIELINLLEAPPRHKPGMKVAFCDFAEGKSEHAIGYRDGNKITVAAAWIDANKKSAVGRFILEFRKLRLKPEQIWCDASDLEMWTLLKDFGWPIRRKNFGSPASNDGMYVSWGAEAWQETAIDVTTGAIILDIDEKSQRQLTTRKKVITPKGKQGLEDKHEMAKRGLSSPDRGDVICGVNRVFDNAQLPAQKQPFTVTGWRDHIPNSGEMSIDEEIGALV